jgi:hypothetical protein
MNQTQRLLDNNLPILMFSQGEQRYSVLDSYIYQCGCCSLTLLVRSSVLGGALRARGHYVSTYGKVER